MHRSPLVIRIVFPAVLTVLAGVLLFHLAFGRTEAGQAAARTKSAIKSLKRALVHYQAHTGRLPGTAEGLRVLVQAPGQFPRDLWSPPELEYLPRDGWGREFRYAAPPAGRHAAGHAYEIVSAGPDGRFGDRDDVRALGTLVGPDPRIEENALGVDWLLGLVTIGSGLLVIHGLRAEQRQSATRRRPHALDGF